MGNNDYLNRRDLLAKSSVIRPNGIDLTKAMLGLDQPEPQIIYQTDENAIVPVEDGFVYKRFTMTPIGMVIPEDVSEAEWEDIGHRLKIIDSVTSWNIGDWAEYANKAWHISYDQIAEHFGYEPETLNTYAWVSRSFQTSIRNRYISFAHHRLVANVDNVALTSAWLNYAAAAQISVKDMQKQRTLLAGHTEDAALGWLLKALSEGQQLTIYPQITDGLPKSRTVKGTRSFEMGAKQVLKYVGQEERLSDAKRQQAIQAALHLRQILNDHLAKLGQG